MNLRTIYRKDEGLLVVENEQGDFVLREIPCCSHQEAVRMASIVQDFYMLGRQRCINEITKANEILNQYNISGIKTPKK